MHFSALPVSSYNKSSYRDSRDAHPPATTLVLVHQDNAVFLAFIDRTGRTGRDAAGIQTMLADPREIHHEGVFELRLDVLLDSLDIVVLGALVELAAENRPPNSDPRSILSLALPGDEWQRPRGGQQSVIPARVWRCCSRR